MKSAVICVLAVLTSNTVYAKDHRLEAREHLSKARLWAARAEFEKMLEEAQEAAQEDPSLAEAQAWIAIYQYRFGSVSDARLLLMSVVAKNPNLGLARVYLADILYDEGDQDRAFDEWATAVRLSPTEPEALAGYALGLFKSSQLAGATKYMKQALMQDRRYYDAKFLRDRKKGAAWSQRRVDDIAPLLKTIEHPTYPY
jgi:tetratricopeptide (TPR) repeat protein